MIEHSHLNEPIKHIVDAVSLVTALGSFAQILPPLAALLSLIWSGIRIYEYIKTKRIKD